MINLTYSEDKQHLNGKSNILRGYNILMVNLTYSVDIQHFDVNT